MSRLLRGDWWRTAAVVAAVVVLGTLVVPALAADGDFDPSFGGDGTVVTDVGFDDSGESVAVQADGRIVVAGTSCGGGGDFLVARYLTGGALDPSFAGGSGRACIDVHDGSADQGQQVVVLADGRLLVAGTSGGDFAVVRLTAAGAVDPTFGTGGVALLDLGGTEVLRDLDVAPDGKLVLTGETSATPGCGIGPTPTQTFGAAVVRTSSEGVVDAGFGTGGRAVRISQSQVERANAAIVLPDGAIVVAGRVATCSRAGIGAEVYRLTPAGQPDPTFSGGTVFDSGPTSAADIARQPDGKLLVLVDSFVGPASVPAHDDAFTIVRYDAEGHVDAGFGTGGVARAFFGDGTNATPMALALQADRVVVAGALGTDSALARFTAGGILDGTFDGDGRLAADLGGTDLLAALAVQADAKVVGAGRAGSDVAVVRIGTASPAPPTTLAPTTTVAPDSFVCGLVRQLARQPFLGFLSALLPRFGCRL